MPKPIKILFVCGQRNRRSLTAEHIFKSDRRLEVRQAGLSDTSKRRLGDADVKWADLILAMERKHAKRIRSSYGHIEPLPEIESLDIQDKFIYMQPELVEELREGLEAVLEETYPELYENQH